MHLIPWLWEWKEAGGERAEIERDNIKVIARLCLIHILVSSYLDLFSTVLQYPVLSLLISRTGTTCSSHFLGWDKERKSKSESQNILLQGTSYPFTKSYYKIRTISSVCHQLAATIERLSSKWQFFQVSYTQIGRRSLPLWLPPRKSSSAQRSDPGPGLNWWIF